MKERVRAILFTSNDTMLVMKRARPGVAPYWVVPGGGVEPTDLDRETALKREIKEELAGEINVISLLHVLEAENERQYFYLATIKNWSFEERTGPEFADDSRGEYLLEEIPFTRGGIASIDLKPEAIGDLLRGALSTTGGLYAQTDLRQPPE
ncbi:MAG TPA: NUDIX domain-containing protein [Actinocrinis sp.]|uniref:NUDIX hydrolase n=1 Tax=Actinocrinis sp. TaxID=1920516 RepID=UPI002DDD00C1|nr:NUDIX domain-containing protein [Actinocrinis sp.]HEV2347011.1 NUDIX domain-containing protein [Actinocrinis sp.]